MDLSGELELFSRTPENRFIFSLFDLLLCGVIVLVIIRGWRAQRTAAFGPSQFLLLLAFVCLGASFGLEATFAGASFFLSTRLPEALFDLLSHTFQAAAWVLMAASIYREPVSASRTKEHSAGPSRSFALVAVSSQLFIAPLKTTVALDLTNLVLVSVVLFLFRRRWSDGKRFVTGAVSLLFISALLQVGASLTSDSGVSLVLWNLEQFGWSFSLFVFALAIGEASRELFDKVFVRLQIAFILLASVMILVITQTEKADYLAGIRDRSGQLAEFVRGHVDYFRRQEQTLPNIVEREDFLQRAIMGFGNLPELKVVRIIADDQVATFEIADGEVYSGLESASSPPPLDLENYFLIHSLPLTSYGRGAVQFYGTREFIDQHIRKRIFLIFSLFTAMVALSTVMIGLVVRGASHVIRQQAREIERTQQQLVQSSKLAAIGELAAGVAHEINNPVTTILSMSSFWLSEQEKDRPSCDPEDVKEVVAQAQRIAQVTSALLTFSRRQTLDIKPVPVDSLIDASLRQVEPLLRANEIRVRKDLQPGLPRILGDESSLIRALDNLIRNAVDAMPRGGELQISVAPGNPSGDQIRLDVSDTGAGISRDVISRIFDPFFTTKEVGKGTGLGLSIVHGIVREHQGTISVESEPGLGTKFTILLPVEEQP
jgi:signal transduction histidine kinase